METDPNGFAMGKRGRAFRAIEAILRADPVLAANVRTWASWRGDNSDVLVPTAAMMPMIRLSPQVYPNKGVTANQMAATVGVRVEAFVRGTVADHLMNLWDAVEDAFGFRKPFRGTTVDCYLNAEVGAYELESTIPGFGAWQSNGPDPINYLAGDGRIVIAFLTDRR